MKFVEFAEGEGSPAFVNPWYVLTVSAALGEDGVPIPGQSVLRFVTGVKAQANGDPRAVVEKLNAAMGPDLPPLPSLLSAHGPK